VNIADFAITGIDARGIGEMTFDPSTDISNNVYLSLTIPKGSWFFNPLFGLRRRGRMKNTERTASLIAEDARSALQWLLDSGRASKIEVSTERDPLADPYRLKLLVEVMQKDGNSVSFAIFKEVV
jgi:phage gp46-like protein